MLLVTVTVPPAIEQPPVAVITTGSPELDVAATGNVSPNAAVAGAAVVTVMVWAVLAAVVEDDTCDAGS